jgi:hypothetical protein
MTVRILKPVRVLLKGAVITLSKDQVVSLSPEDEAALIRGKDAEKAPDKAAESSARDEGQDDSKRKPGWPKGKSRGSAPLNK